MAWLSPELLARKVYGYDKQALNFEIPDAGSCHFLLMSEFTRVEKVTTARYPWETDGEPCGIVCSVRFDNTLGENKHAERTLVGLAF